MHKITVIGLGTVGMPLATWLARNHNVAVFDVDHQRIQYLQDHWHTLDCGGPVSSSLIYDEPYSQAITTSDFIILTLPTNGKLDGTLDTSIITNEVQKIAAIPHRATIIIRSTLPIGYTQKLINLYNQRIVFCPEFCRGDFAMLDIMDPSRIVVSDNLGLDIANQVIDLFNPEREAPVTITGLDEAEAIKIFSNTYLAMRIAFFNEIDTYARRQELNVSDIIRGISLDPRIGNYYNRPSCGFGGYCLPKDSKQAAHQTRSPLIKSIDKSNQARIEYIVTRIWGMLDEAHDIIGVYKVSKYSILNKVIEKLEQELKLKVIYYTDDMDLDHFIDGVDLILTDNKIINEKMLSKTFLIEKLNRK